MAKIHFSHIDKTVAVDEGEWLYEVVADAEAGIPFSCKAGACGTCATEVLEGFENLGKQTARELRTLDAEGIDAQTHRLLCLCDVGGDIVFGAPKNAGDTESRLATVDVLVESYRPLNENVAEVRFFVENPDFAFTPGQYMIFHVPHPDKVLRRSYSISTPPSDKRHFEVCVRSIAGGHGSNYIHRLRPGMRLQAEGPYGDFVLRESSSRNILMVATGTGVAPIKSMLMHLLDIRSSRRVELFFGVRHEDDLFYTDLFRGLAAHYPHFKYHITLSSPNPERWSGPKGRVTHLIDGLVHERHASDTEVYICGSREMIEDSKELLLGKGFSEHNIHHENFY